MGPLKNGIGMAANGTKGDSCGLYTRPSEFDRATLLVVNLNFFFSPIRRAFGGREGHGSFSGPEGSILAKIATFFASSDTPLSQARKNLGHFPPNTQYCN